MTMRRAICRVAICMLLACLAPGCAQWKLPKSLPLAGKDEDKPQAAQRMTALWSDTVLVEAGVTGFGGRLMFYGKGEDPIKVEGELTVFAYDDTNDAENQSLPARKYVFRAEDLEKHYSTSTLGHSYSFWIPWSSVGGPARQISLIARFKSAKGGGVVMSEMTRHYLPGSQNPASTSPAPISNAWNSSSGPVRRAAHQTVADPPPAEKPQRLETTTITLPPHMGSKSTTDAAVDAMMQRLATARAQQAGALASAPQAALAAQATPQAIAQQASVSTQAPVSQQAAVAPQAADPAAKTLDEAADAATVRALVREVRALRESVESDRSPADRSGPGRHRARIEPKLPPTRDPVRMPRPLGAQPSAPTSTPPTDPSTRSAANAPNAWPTTIGQQ